MTKGIRLKKELAASMILTLAVFIGTILDLPPFGTVMTIGESIKFSWEEGQSQAPAPHTELKTLEEVVKDLDMEMGRVLDKLERHGIKVTDTGAMLKSIAADNGISPSELYRVVSRRGEGRGMGRGEGRGMGSGRGQERGAGASESANISADIDETCNSDYDAM